MPPADDSGGDGNREPAGERGEQHPADRERDHLRRVHPDSQAPAAPAREGRRTLVATPTAYAAAMPAPADTTPAWDSDAVLDDGTTVHVRPLREDDAERVRDLCRRLSQHSLYYRFFTAMPAERASAIELEQRVDLRHHFALLVELRGEILGIARYDRTDATGPEAEVAFLVRDDWQGRGVGTLLLEHLAAIARTQGISRLVAVTLTRNYRMLDVLAHSGFPSTRELDAGALRVTLSLDGRDRAPQDRRERASESESIAHVLRPRSIAVVGASRQRDTIGNAVLRNLLDGAFVGPVHAVNRAAAEAGETVEGITAVASVVDVPGPVGLAVVCVPAAHVLDVARDCIEKRVDALVAISAGFAEVGDAEAQHRLAAMLRANGVRLVGPNCIGIVNTAEDVQMNATFLPIPPRRGRVGVASQSGGLAIELLARAGTLGLGVSTFVSLGNKADVSGNDLLQYWAEDPGTDVIVLYLESFGNPRKFARLARDISHRKPIVAVKGGRTEAGARGASSHTAALATPDVAVDALFRQAGVVRVDTLEELFETTNVLLHQPLPAGRRVAIITNGGGPGILAADACAAAGLEVPELADATQAALRDVVAAEASVANPVDLIASASAEVYERAMRVLLADPSVDALIAVFVPPLVTDAGDVARAITRAARDAQDTTLVACFLGRNGLLDVLTDGPGDDTPRVPSFAFPESAARALAGAVHLAEWRAAPTGEVPELSNLDTAAARTVAADALVEHAEGTWLDFAQIGRMLEAVGVPVVESHFATSADEAAAQAEAIGMPIALKAAAPTLVHKTEAGGVRLDLATADDVRAAFDAMHARLGDEMGGAVVQAMASPGLETIVGVTRDASFGPLVLFGMGGTTAELLRDTNVRIAPVSDVEAHDLVRSLRTSPLLFGYRGSAPVDVAALEEIVVRIGLLAEHVPEIAELDCNPVIVTPDGVVVVDAKVRVEHVAEGPPEDLRRLRDV